MQKVRWGIQNLNMQIASLQGITKWELKIEALNLIGYEQRASQQVIHSDGPA